jgi:hypothetical protein
MLHGAVVYSPSACCTAPLSTRPSRTAIPSSSASTLPATWDFWAHFHRTMLQRADALEVLMLDSWHRLDGVDCGDSSRAN